MLWIDIWEEKRRAAGDCRGADCWFRFGLRMRWWLDCGMSPSCSSGLGDMLSRDNNWGLYHCPLYLVAMRSMSLPLVHAYIMNKTVAAGTCKMSVFDLLLNYILFKWYNFWLNRLIQIYYKHDLTLATKGYHEVAGALIGVCRVVGILQRKEKHLFHKTLYSRWSG